jgi:GDPmannose 4,6-dehydratase
MRAHNLHAVNRILFNHESPRRGSKFVTNKVVEAACAIKLGLLDKLELGNMDSYRDWGRPKDYVRAMHAVLNHDVAGDFGGGNWYSDIPSPSTTVFGVLWPPRSALW